MASLVATAVSSLGSGLKISVATRGGELATKFTAQVAADAQRVVQAAFLASVRRRVLPKLKAAMPVRTGRLRGSIKIRPAVKGVAVVAIWYAIPLGVRVVAHQIAEQERGNINKDIATALRAYFRSIQ